MGVDAEMFVRVKGGNYTREAVKRIAYDLGSAFGPDKFWIFKDCSWADDGSVRHAATLIEKYEQDGPDIEPEDGEQFIQIHPATRYYGEGYERGNLPFLIMLAEWLERRIPGGVVWYGGDSSGVEAEPFDKAAREKLWAHFCAVAHAPYDDVFDNDSHSITMPRPICPICDVKMKRYGWGAKYGAFNCSGCDERRIWRDGIWYKQSSEGADPVPVDQVPA